MLTKHRVRRNVFVGILLKNGSVQEDGNLSGKCLSKKSLLSSGLHIKMLYVNLIKAEFIFWHPKHKA
jgi:hypothetical protein